MAFPAALLAGPAQDTARCAGFPAVPGCLKVIGAEGTGVASLKSLARLFRKPSAPVDAHVFDAPLRPKRPLAVIGDVHGEDRQLARLLDRIDAGKRQIVQVGDMIDRGEESAAVLHRLMAREDVICLMGNHELMCLDFLDDPEAAGPRWLRNGGLETLESFGVGLGSGQDKLAKARDALARAMGDDLIEWLRARPSLLQSGNVVVTHAGADPDTPMDMQKPAVLAWGHAGFLRKVRVDGLWVVYGHRIVDEAHAADGRIAVDTGAYATGRLTVALIDEDDLRFFSA